MIQLTPQMKRDLAKTGTNLVARVKADAVTE